VPQAASLRRRLQEPRGGFAGPFTQRRLTKRSREHTFPDVGNLCVMVPKCAENWLRFSARLHEGAPQEVRFERIF
jgi:hypothetical protein